MNEDVHVLLNDDSKLVYKLHDVLMKLKLDDSVNITRNLVGDDLEYEIIGDKLYFKLVRKPESYFVLHYDGESSEIGDEAYTWLSEMADDYIFEVNLANSMSKCLSNDPEVIRQVIENEFTKEFGKDWEYDDGSLYWYYLDLTERYGVSR